ncbi:hypothetical protein L226DRAFT_202592 [Lentinus tigrinus ALCF2SS1-7]|uniref:uncharacterized protein n=1 Tax=Lentinus tigrinus ALCF2SS1-7 TaxID=1328758 RepID=UPI00116632CB|nr:hypothetical protein L226DRAFT_202592 [Lentinus tigrinus ALCF2SS1-7]
MLPFADLEYATQSGDRHLALQSSRCVFTTVPTAVSPRKSRTRLSSTLYPYPPPQLGTSRPHDFDRHSCIPAFRPQQQNHSNTIPRSPQRCVWEIVVLILASGAPFQVPPLPSGERHAQTHSGVPPASSPQASTSTPTTRCLEPTARRSASARCPWIAGRGRWGVSGDLPRARSPRRSAPDTPRFRFGFTLGIPRWHQLHPLADRAQQSGLPTSSTPGAPGMWTSLLGVLGILAGLAWGAKRRSLSSSLWFTCTVTRRVPSTEATGCFAGLLPVRTRVPWSPAYRLVDNNISTVSCNATSSLHTRIAEHTTVAHASAPIGEVPL